jgi:hypothetical protein
LPEAKLHIPVSPIFQKDARRKRRAVMRKFRDFKELKKSFFEERKPCTLKKCIFVGIIFWGLPVGLCLILFFWKEIKVYYAPWEVTAMVLPRLVVCGFLFGCAMYVFGMISLKLKDKRARKKLAEKKEGGVL